MNLEIAYSKSALSFIDKNQDTLTRDESDTNYFLPEKSLLMGRNMSILTIQAVSAGVESAMMSIRIAWRSSSVMGAMGINGCTRQKPTPNILTC